MRTSTRLTARRLPNRFVTRVASRSAMRLLTLRTRPGEGEPWRVGAHGRAPLRWVQVLRLPQLQRCRLALADGDESAILDLNQRPLLDRITGVLALNHVDDGDLAIRAGETREILDVGQRLANFPAIGLETLGRIGDVGLLDGLGQHLHGVVTVR